MSMIKQPEFKPVPKGSFANVDENIQLYRSNKTKHANIGECLVKDSTKPLGYRWIDAEELTETIRTEQWFKRKDKNICIEFIFIRRYHAKDISFTPLYFSEWYTTIICKYKFGNNVEVYTSDAALKRFIASIK
jgi:hypothetical protein